MHTGAGVHGRWLSFSICALGLTGLGAADAAGRPLVLDDILRMEDVGVVQVDPTGRRIVFERIPEYQRRGDFAVDEARLTASVFVYAPGQSAPPQPLAEMPGVSGQWIGGFSPKGTRLALYWREGDVTHAGVYDFSARRLTTFPFTPYFDFTQAAPVWKSEDEIIYSTLPAGSQPTRPAFRRVAARRLAIAWEKAWRGEESTVDVIESGPVNSQSPMRAGALVKVNLHTGAIETVANGLYLSLSLSPDGHYLAAAQRGGLQAPRAGTQSRGGQGPYRFDPVLIRIDLATHRVPVNMCPGCELTLSSFEWAPTSTAVAFFAQREGETWNESTYKVFSVADGKTLHFAHTGLDLISQRERGQQAIPEQAIPFGSGLALPARAQPDSEAPSLFSDRPHKATGMGRVDWYLLSPTGKPKNLTATLTNVSPVAVAVTTKHLYVLADARVWRLSAQGRPVELTAGLPYKLSYSRPLDPEGYEVRDLRVRTIAAYSVGDAPAGVVFFDLERKTAVAVPVPEQAALVSAASSAAVAVFRRGGRKNWALISVAEKDQREFWTFNTHLAQVEPARQVNIDYALPSGSRMTSCALMPPSWTPGKRVPLVVEVYPGPSSRCLTYAGQGVIAPYDQEILAGMGYMVLSVIPPAEELRTSRGPLGNWAKAVLPAVDALIDAGYADPERVGLLGSSYGSISALALLAQTNRFRAAAISNGAANFSSHYGQLGIVRRLLPEDLFAVGQATSYEGQGSYLWLGGPTPWSDPVRYVAASPLFEVDKIETPLLLMHADLDWGYPMAQFDEVFTALLRMGKTAMYARYWGEGHEVNSPANLRDAWSRIERWYTKYLNNERAPEP